MKHIGFTTEGNDLVEMSKEEYAAFVQLNMAVESKTGLPVFASSHDYRMDFDFSHTFQVIKAWWLARLRINEFQLLLDEMREGLEK